MSEQSFLLGEWSASYPTEAPTPRRMGLPHQCLHLQPAQCGRTTEDPIQAEDPGRGGAPHHPEQSLPPNVKVTPTRGVCGQLHACAETTHSNHPPTRSHTRVTGRSGVDISLPVALGTDGHSQQPPPQPGVTHISLEGQAWTSHSLWHWTQMDTHSTRRTGASPYSSQRDEVGGFLEEVAP